MQSNSLFQTESYCLLNRENPSTEGTMAGNDLDQAVPFVIPDVSASQREPENKMTDSK